MGESVKNKILKVGHFTGLKEASMRMSTAGALGQGFFIGMVGYWRDAQWQRQER